MATLLKQAQQLVQQKREDEARHLVLEAASGPEPDPTARQAYEDLFPLTDRQKQWIDSTLKNLSARDAKVRAQAAKDLCRGATAESYPQRDFVGEPRVLDYIVPALGSDDPKVSECAAVAVARAAQFYLRDWWAREPVTALLKAKQPNTRRWAVQAVAYLGREKAIPSILPLIEDKAELPRNEVPRMLISMLQKHQITASEKDRLEKELLKYVESKTPEVRQTAINILRVINNPAVIKPLQAALKREPRKDVRESIQYALRCLEAGDPLLPA